MDRGAPRKTGWYGKHSNRKDYEEVGPFTVRPLVERAFRELRARRGEGVEVIWFVPPSGGDGDGGGGGESDGQ